MSVTGWLDAKDGVLLENREQLTQPEGRAEGGMLRMWSSVFLCRITKILLCLPERCEESQLDLEP